MKIRGIQEIRQIYQNNNGCYVLLLSGILVDLEEWQRLYRIPKENIGRNIVIGSENVFNRDFFIVAEPIIRLIDFLIGEGFAGGWGVLLALGLS